VRCGIIKSGLKSLLMKIDLDLPIKAEGVGMKKFYLVLLVLIMIFMFTGCAAEMNVFEKVVPDSGEIAGFWNGLWHGIIAPFAFIISLFSDSVGVYELHNNGNWYNFGFMIGLSIILGGGGRSSRRRRRRNMN
jgi:hypothetical protein